MSEEVHHQREEAISYAEFAKDQLEVAIKDRDHAEKKLAEALAEIDRLRDQVRRLTRTQVVKTRSSAW